MNANAISQTEAVKPCVHGWNFESQAGPVQSMNSNPFSPFLDRVVGPDGAAEVLDISPRMLLSVRDDPTFPEPRYIGRLPRWTASSLMAWVGAPASQQSLAAASVEVVDLDAELADLADEEAWNVH